MDPFEIQEASRRADPIKGLRPPAPITVHAESALAMLREWIEAKRRGKVVRTRTGEDRVLPKSTTMLARQYVYDQVVREDFATERDYQYARRYYTYALDVAICAHLEDLAQRLSSPDKGTRSSARYWMHTVRQLGLEE